MKKQGFFKKLGLNKKTVANLENNDLKVVRGGATLLCTITQGQECQTLYTRCIICSD